MYLKFIDPDTMMEVFIEDGDAPCDQVFGRFHALETDTSFYLESIDLFDCFDHFDEKTFLNISFLRGEVMYSFLARPVSKKHHRDEFLVLIQQRTAIVTTTRRQHQRDEIQMTAKLYGLSPETFHERHEIAKEEEVEFDGDVFDISPGGIGFVSNKPFSSKYEPYFLVEFELGPRDRFLLPAKLVRKGNSPQTMRYKYDFGLYFLYDGIPQEKSRLTAALLEKKLSLLK